MTAPVIPDYQVLLDGPSNRVLWRRPDDPYDLRVWGTDTVVEDRLRALPDRSTTFVHAPDQPRWLAPYWPDNDGGRYLCQLWRRYGTGVLTDASIVHFPFTTTGTAR